jgi:hypothetical protein
MKADTMLEISDFFKNDFSSYLKEIRGDNTKAFTRNRKISPYNLLLQMFAQKGKTQFSELINYYSDIEKPLDISTVGFYKARMNFNPEAIRKMSNDFINKHYKEFEETLVKLNGYYILAIDGSELVLPSSSENAEIYGRSYAGNKACPQEDRPVLAKLSILYDCINHLALDSQLEGYKYGEKKLALRHLDCLQDNIRDKSIIIFDRGYYSIRLLDKMIDNNQKFLFRLQKDHLRRYSSQLECGEDKFFEVKYLKGLAKDYKDDCDFFNKITSTTYKLRFAKILVTDNGANTEEILLTNLSNEEFDITGLKELYHLRWNIETSYNILKNKLKIEEFSGYRNRLIRQDIYSTIWLSNIVSLLIIECNLKHEIPYERYKYQMKRNTNQIIGIIKSHFIKSLVFYDSPDKYKELNLVNLLIKTKLVPIRKDRTYKRANVKNVSRRSYRYSY